MIAVDTSALLAILLDEAEADELAAALAEANGLVISAGTVAEAFIVAERRGLAAQMQDLLDALSLEVAPVTAAVAEDIGGAYRRWGKGVHSAGLNLGDCFAYVLASGRRIPLLFKGDDFAQTDLAAAI